MQERATAGYRWHLVSAGQRIEQAAHPRGGDRQRPSYRASIQAQVKLTLPGRRPLPGRRLQQLQLDVIVGRAEVLDIPRPAMVRPVPCPALPADQEPIQCAPFQRPPPRISSISMPRPDNQYRNQAARRSSPLVLGLDRGCLSL